MTYCVGIDPGKPAGGVALMDDNRLVWSVSYKKLKRKSGDIYQTSQRVPGYKAEDREFTDLGLVAEALFFSGIMALDIRSYVLSIEGLKTFQMKNAKSMTALCESAGIVYGPFLKRATQIFRPMSQAWRKGILGISEKKLGADASEKVAIHIVNLEHPDLKQPNGHACEAICIAKYGIVYANLTETV